MPTRATCLHRVFAGVFNRPTSFLGLLAWCGLAGCAVEEELPVCDAPEPAFRLQVRSAEGALPEDLKIEVGFGGAQRESYTLGSDTRGDVVCCVSIAALSDAPARVPCAGGEPDFVSPLRLVSRDASSVGPDAGRSPMDAGRSPMDAGRSPMDAGRSPMDAATTPPGVGEQPGLGYNFVVCDLWTNGAAELTARSAGQELVEQTLPARPQEESGTCRLLQTVQAEFLLGTGDAGVVLRH